MVSEWIAIETCPEIIHWLKNNDSTTRRITEDILKMEEEHADDLAGLLEVVESEPDRTRSWRHGRIGKSAGASVGA